MRASNIKRQKKSSLSKQQKLPKTIRDELRMTCVLRGLSAMRQEGQKTQVKQNDFMYDFFHGIEGKRPSQIKMVAEGTSVYKDLYETTVKPVVNKKYKKVMKQGASSVKRKRLKSVLTRQERMHYYSGYDITHTDLEKKIDLKVMMPCPMEDRFNYWLQMVPKTIVKHTHMPVINGT